MINKKNVVHFQNENTTEVAIEKIKNRVKHHQLRIFLLGIFTIVALMIIYFIIKQRTSKEEVAQKAMLHAVHCFEQGLYDEALQGDQSQMGFIQVTKNYPRTKSANMSYFYAGTIYMNNRDFDSAITFLEKFNSSEPVIQNQVWVLMGDSFSEKKNYAKAAEYYMKAANNKANKISTPLFLIKAAIVYEVMENYSKALQCYKRISDEYPTTEYFGDACKQIARLTN